jgi:hypothetical protein
MRNIQNSQTDFTQEWVFLLGFNGKTLKFSNFTFHIKKLLAKQADRLFL